MLTIAPDTWPYSALNAELSTLNSWMLPSGGSKISEPNVRLLVVTPLTRNATASSRLPAVLKASAPMPRIGLDENPVCDGATDPGTSSPRSVKWRPFSGICCTVCAVTTWPTVAVARSTSGTSARTTTVSLRVADRQVEVAHQRAADVEHERLDHLGAKAGRLDRDFVDPRRDRRDIAAVAIAVNGNGQPRRHLTEVDRGPGNDPARRINDPSLQRRHRLRTRECRGTQQQCRPQRRRIATAPPLRSPHLQGRAHDLESAM